MSTLYRKYRPQSFNEAVGQNHIRMTIEQEISSGRIANAYLFCGPRGVGKTTFARLIAKSLNCLNRKDSEANPCDNCGHCREISAGGSIDVIEIDAASHTGVDNIRENVIASARIAPSNSKYKVFIIDEVHMLSASAFNALLKIIEEPPKNVVFIFCTTEAHKVPLTIISRCQRFDFKKISFPDVVRKLEYIVEKEEIKAEKSVLEEIARHSGGHMRDAESLLSQVIAVAGKKITEKEASLVIPRGNLPEAVSLIELISKKDAGNAIRLLNKLIGDGFDLKVFSENLIEVLRGMMVIRINPVLADQLSISWGEALDRRIRETAKSIEVGEIIEAIREFTAAREQIKGSFIPELPFETVVVRLCISASPAMGFDNRSILGQNQQKGNPAGNGGENRAPGKTPAAADNNGLEKKAIIEKWNEFLARIKKYNHSLTFILGVCELSDVSNGELYLSFKYKFHKDRIEDPTIKVLVEKALREVYGAPLRIRALIDENLKVSAENTEEAPASETPTPEAGGEAEEKKPEVIDNEAVNNLLRNFGGRVIK